MVNIECQKTSNNNTVAIIVFRSVEHPRISSSLGVGILEKDLQIENINSVIVNVQELALQIQESNKTSHDKIENIIIENIIVFLKQIKPSMILISSPIKTINLNRDKNKSLEGDKILDSLEAANMIEKVVIGGSAITFNYKKILDFYNVICCIGEGEITIRKLAKYLGGKQDIKEIQGIAFRESRIGGNEKNIIHQKRNELFDLQGSGTPNSRNIEWALAKNGTLWAESSRGCYYNCTFCSIHSTKIKINFWRKRTVEDVVNGMEDIVKTYLNWLDANNIPKDKHDFLVLYSDDDFMGNGNVEEIYDSTGNTLESSDLQRAERISEGFYNISRKYNIDIQWGISTRSDAVYRPIIKEEEYTGNIPGYIKLDTEEQNEEREKIWLDLKKNGLKSVFLGIDSGSPSQLKRYGKLTTPIHNEEAIKFLKKIGIQLFVGFITFDPLMNLQELTENIEFMKRNDIYESITNPLSSLRITEGTPYKRMAQSFGIVGSKRDDFWTYNAIYINPLIDIINVITQEWTKKQYSLVYAIKGQAIKDSKDISKAMWWQCLETFKSLDFELLAELTETAIYFSKIFSITESDWRNFTQSRIKAIQPSSYIEEKIFFINEELMKIYYILKSRRHLHIQNYLTKINRGEIKDTDFIIANEIYKSNSQNL